MSGTLSFTDWTNPTQRGQLYAHALDPMLPDLGNAAANHLAPLGASPAWGNRSIYHPLQSFGQAPGMFGPEMAGGGGTGPGGGGNFSGSFGDLFGGPGLGSTPGNPSGIHGFDDPGVPGASLSDIGQGARLGFLGGGLLGAGIGSLVTGPLGAAIGAGTALFSGGEPTQTGPGDAEVTQAAGEFGGPSGGPTSAEKAGRGGLDPGDEEEEF